MEKRELLSRLDHTLLKQTATWEEIRRICEEGMKYQQIGIPPEEAQFLETRKFQINEIASMYRIVLVVYILNLCGVCLCHIVNN